MLNHDKVIVNTLTNNMTTYDHRVLRTAQNHMYHTFIRLAAQKVSAHQHHRKHVSNEWTSPGDRTLSAPL